MIYLHIVVAIFTYPPIYLHTYQPILHIRSIYFPCQIIVPHNLSFWRSSYTLLLLIITLQQRYRHNEIMEYWWSAPQSIESLITDKDKDRHCYIKVCLRDYTVAVRVLLTPWFWRTSSNSHMNKPLQMT
jgi:hypothetical protein